MWGVVEELPIHPLRYDCCVSVGGGGVPVPSLLLLSPPPPRVTGGWLGG